jgi:polysaccharide export outer membrane protein
VIDHFFRKLGPLNMKRILLLSLAIVVLSFSVARAAEPAAGADMSAALGATDAGGALVPATPPATAGASLVPDQEVTTIPKGQTLPPVLPGQGGAAPEGQTIPGQVVKTIATTPGATDVQATPKVADKAETSSLEDTMSEDQTSAEKSKPQKFKVGRITQFGYSFFKAGAKEFAPLTDIPVGPDYVIGAGDHIVLTLWGSIDGTYELEVNRSGEVVLPKVGAVKVSGESFGKLPALLQANLARVFKDFHLNVNMGKTRIMKVYLVGQVTSPGDYNLSSLSTLINALAAAGGPTKNGSLRNIEIKRNGKLIESVDLYDFFLKGDKGRDIRLQPGDTIFVPVIGPVAGIAGNVRQPAIYELKGEQTLKDLLALAGGINPTGYLQRVQISRVQAHEKKLVTEANLDPKEGKSTDELTGAIPIKDLDLVKVFPIDSTLRGYARLEGYVLRPGDYALKPGMRLSTLLKEDNLLPEYYTADGQITRLYPPDLHPEVMFFNVAKALKGDPASDLELKEFDQVKIFSRWQMEEMPTVLVRGEVQKPGTYRLFKNMTVRDLLMQAGNLKLTAYLKDAEISRIKHSGEAVTSYSITVNLAEALKGGKANLKLEPFDELSVRKIPNWAEETDRNVTLKGEFVFPGVYPIYRGEHLSSIIKRAGGYTDKAYLPGAKFTRELVREIQQKRMDEVLAKTEVDISKKKGELASTASSPEELAATKASLEALMNTVEMLKKAKAEGRLVTKLSNYAMMKDSPYDLEAMGGDTIEVPPDPQMVSVLGQVFNPTSFVFQPGEKIADYLKRAGGTTREADSDEIYLIRADGTVVSRQSSSAGLLGFGGFMAQQVESGDTVVVPQRLEKVAWMREIKDMTTILSQTALTAGVLIAAGL